MARVFFGILLFAAAELFLLVRGGSEIGVTATLLIMIATALVGVVAARAQGLSVFRKWLDAMADGQQPEEGLADGLLVVSGGLLLVLPGPLGDLIGLLLLIPPLRRVVAERLRRRAQGWVRRGDVEVFTMHTPVDDPRDDVYDGPREIIDAEGVVVVEATGVEIVSRTDSRAPIALLPRGDDR